MDGKKDGGLMVGWRDGWMEGRLNDRWMSGAWVGDGCHRDGRESPGFLRSRSITFR